MQILSPIKKFDNTNVKSYINENNASISVSLYSNKTVISKKKSDKVYSDLHNFKVVFLGDMESEAIGELVNNSALGVYRRAFSKNVVTTDTTTNERHEIEYNNVYYKVSHHGKRKNASFVKGNSFYDNEYNLLNNYIKPTYCVGTAWRGRDKYITTQLVQGWENTGLIIPDPKKPDEKFLYYYAGIDNKSKVSDKIHRIINTDNLNDQQHSAVYFNTYHNFRKTLNIYPTMYDQF